MLDHEALTVPIIVGFILATITLLIAVIAVVTRRRQFGLAAQVVIPLATIALLGSVAAYRFRYAGQWLPQLPDAIGNWKVIDTPISANSLSILGNPMATGHEYDNAFGEVVYSTAVCAGPFENYHDPTVCVPGNGFALTAKKTIPMGIGNWKVRAMIFKRTGTDRDIRIMMYYWTQTRLGHTTTEAQMGNFRDIAARFQTGISSVVHGEQNVIVRIYTILPPNDTNGVQSQRNLNEISRETYKQLLQEGAKRS